MLTKKIFPTQQKKPTEHFYAQFLEFLAIKGTYFDYFFASWKSQNDHLLMKMVSNKSMRCFSIVFIKNIIQDS